jgi:ADP-ribosyl-[dinitrogen reductase] hydrolase
MNIMLEKTAEPTREERIMGGLYGSLVGDALGVPVEFSSRAARLADPVSDMRGWGTWNQRPGTWSDDGALMLCSLEAVHGVWSLERMGDLFVRWAKTGYWTARGNVFDIGTTTLNAIERLAAGCPPELAGGYDESSNGNGSLMRILPVALRFANAGDPELTAKAMEASTLTHRHIRSQLACAFLCLLVRRLLDGLAKQAAYAQTCAAFSPLLGAHPAEQAVFARLCSGRLEEVAQGAIKSGGYVIDTLEASVWCLLREESFAAATLAAVNLGGDTDTTGCVTGGLAGILHGLRAIPEDWRGVLPRAGELATAFRIFAEPRA